MAKVIEWFKGSPSTKERFAVYAIIVLLLVVQLATCGSPEQSEYSKAIDNWTAQMGQSRQEYRANYEAITANLSAQLGQSKARVSGLQATLDNTQSENDRLEAQIKSLPTQDDIRLVKLMLGEARGNEATARMMYELKQKDFEALKNDYLSAKDSYLTITDLYALLAETFREVVNTGNFSDNQTIEYLEIIRGG